MKNSLSIVIVACYSESHIDLCFLSLLGQAKFDFDVICVDNSPTQKLMERLSFWESRDIKVRRIFEQGKPLGTLLNSAISKAESDYLMFLYGTDIICDANSLETIYQKAQKHSLDLVISPVAWRYDEMTTSFPQKIHYFLKKNIPSNEFFSFDKFGENIHSLAVPDLCGRLFKKSFLIDNKIKFNEKLADPVFAFIVNATEASECISLSDSYFIKHSYQSPFHHFTCAQMTNAYISFCEQKKLNIKSAKTIESYGFVFLLYLAYHLSKTQPLSEFIKCCHGMDRVMEIFDLSQVSLIPQSLRPIWRFIYSISIADGDSNKLAESYNRSYWDDCFSLYDAVYVKPFQMKYSIKERIYMRLNNYLIRILGISEKGIGKRVYQ